MEFNDETIIWDKTTEFVLNTVQCGVIIVNKLDNCEFFVNKELLKIFKDINPDLTDKKLNIMRINDINNFNLYMPNGKKIDYEDLPPIKSIKGEKTKDMEVITKSESPYEEEVVLINSSPVYNELGDKSGSITSVLDITQFKKNENDLIKLVKGKRLISREFNNRLLNIIDTMTNFLQINNEINHEQKDTLNKLNISLIRHIHEILSNYEYVDYVDFKEYLQILCYEIYLLNYNKLIKLEFEGLALITLDMLMVCGLIVNDIIVYRLSSLKPNKKNKILIKFHSDKGKITIKIVDNGPKMPSWAEYESNILKLTPKLLEQLSGFIEIETNEQQTSFLVEILYLEI